MSCPLFVDYCRGCLDKISCLPQDTFDFCTTARYTICPFYKVIQKTGPVCPNIQNCAFFTNFPGENFGELISLTEGFCLSENNKQCKRYLLKQLGESVPPNLYPDGRLC